MEDQTEQTGRLEYQNEEASPRNELTHDVQNPTSNPNTSGSRVYHGEERQLVKEVNRGGLSVLTQERCSSNCDTLMKDNTSKDLTSELIQNEGENRLDNSSTGDATNKDIGKENLNYLNLNSEAKRILGNDVKSNTLSSSNVHQKPGVILLGRGNSFSLGRSEVILLHNRPKSLKDRNSRRHGVGSSKEELVTIKERHVRVENSDMVQLNATRGSDEVESEGSTAIPYPSPPPISNGLNHPESQQSALDSDNFNEDSPSRVIQLVPCYEDDLQNLWRKAEVTMARRNDKVRKILEEFGIGEPGGGGGEDKDCWEDEDVEERKKEEEQVWHIIQENL